MNTQRLLAFAKGLLGLSLTTALICNAALAQESELSGQMRAYWSNKEAAMVGPIAAANLLQSGTVAVSTGERVAQWELRGTQRFGSATVQATASLQAQQQTTAATPSRAWLNEAYATDSAWGWQWTAGKKVVSWDVGYAFRPNDVVQQEARRSLAFESLTGRALVMAEHFGADSAWSMVWVDPLAHASTVGTAPESAWAGRWYQRAGAIDWHGFARHGQQTGASLGGAASWVAADALELHASVRAYQHVATRTSSLTGAALAASNPWQPGLSSGGHQILVGGTWTFESQVSLLLEAWHDGAALSDAQWNDWTARNQGLSQWLARGVSPSAVAGNLAWQANAFGVASSLRQDNVFARISWQQDRWQWALDVLFTPADRGVIGTASVGWSGERVRIDLGLRGHSGPSDAVVRQLPTQHHAYLLATWTY